MEPGPLQPTDATAEAFAHFHDDGGIEAHARELSAHVQAVVPEVMGLSLTFRDPEVTFTLVTTDQEWLSLDGIQYLDDGPCVAAVREDEILKVRADDVLNEERWSLFARASAARGVRSSLSVPLHIDGEVVGSMNIYASSETAFEGHVEEVAALVRAPMATAVRDADLDFSTREHAEETVHTLEARAVIDVAAGILAEREGITVEAAQVRLEVSAARAGVPVVDLAQLLVELHSQN